MTTDYDFTITGESHRDLRDQLAVRLAELETPARMVTFLQCFDEVTTSKSKYAHAKSVRVQPTGLAIGYAGSPQELIDRRNKMSWNFTATGDTRAETRENFNREVQQGAQSSHIPNKDAVINAAFWATEMLAENAVKSINTHGHINVGGDNDGTGTFKVSVNC